MNKPLHLKKLQKMLETTNNTPEEKKHIKKLMGKK